MTRRTLIGFLAVADIAALIACASLIIAHHNWVSLSLLGPILVTTVILTALQRQARADIPRSQERFLRRAAAQQARVASMLAWHKGELRLARRMAVHSRELFTQLGDGRRAALATLNLAWIRGAAGDLDGQSQTAATAQRDAHQAGDVRLAILASTVQAFSALQQARFESAHRALDDAVALGRSHDMHEESRLAERLAAMRAALEGPRSGAGAEAPRLEGELGGLLAWIRGDFRTTLAAVPAEVDNSLPTPLGRDWLIPFAIMAAAELGDLVRARRLAVRLELRYGPGDFAIMRGLTTWASGVLAWREADLQAALHYMETATEQLRRVKANAFAAFVLADLAEVAGEQRRWATAVAAADQLAAIARDCGAASYVGLAEAARAWSEADGKDADVAPLLAKSAADRLDRAGFGAYHARSLSLLGRLLSPVRRPEAIGYLEEAVRIQSGLGAASRVHQNLGLLRKSGHAGRRLVAATRGAGSLTTRERQVMQLAAAGQTSREIAAHLFVTDRTVETHLANGYAKLGMRSRLDLIRRAAELEESAPSNHASL